MTRSANHLDGMVTPQRLLLVAVALLLCWTTPCEAQPIVLDEPGWTSINTHAPDGGNEITDTYSLDLNCDGIVDLEVVSYTYSFDCFGCGGTPQGFVNRARNSCFVRGSLLYISGQLALPAPGTSIPSQAGGFSPYEPLWLWAGESEYVMQVFFDGSEWIFWPTSYCFAPSGLLAPNANPINLVFRFGENNDLVGYVTLRNTPVGLSFVGCPQPSSSGGRIVIDRVAWQPIIAGDLSILFPEAPATYIGDVEDCNGNGVPDSCDLVLFGGNSADENSNRIPDECENPGCAADFDQNGVRDVADIFAFLAAWFAGDETADVDATPGIAVPDIFAFLSTWFAGC